MKHLVKNMTFILSALVLSSFAYESEAREDKKTHCPPCTKEARKLSILLSNDDGVSDNLLALWAELTSRGHSVYSFVPDLNVSGTGEGFLAYAYTLAPLDEENYPNFYLVSAVPILSSFPSTAECVQTGMSWMEIRNLPIDVVITGPNQGLNNGPVLGISGTAGGAAYGASGLVPPPYLNTPAVYVSLDSLPSEERITQTAQFTANLVEYLDVHRDKDNRLLPKGIFLSVNVPTLDNKAYLESCGDDDTNPPIKGVVLTKTGLYYGSSDDQRNFVESWPDFSVTGLVNNELPLGPYYGATNYLNDKRFPTGFSGSIVKAEPFNANTPLTNDVAGKLVLVGNSDSGSNVCFVSTKAENVGAAGGIGMVLAFDQILSFAAQSAQEHPIPSVTIDAASGDEIAAAIDAGADVVLTFDDFVEEDGTIIYYNSGGTNATFLKKGEFDIEASDTNAVAAGYISITPQTNEPTFGTTEDLKNLCCLLGPVLTKGPSLCKEFGFCGNGTSPLLQSKKATKAVTPKARKVAEDTSAKNTGDKGTKKIVRFPSELTK